MEETLLLLSTLEIFLIVPGDSWQPTPNPDSRYLTQLGEDQAIAMGLWIKGQVPGKTVIVFSDYDGPKCRQETADIVAKVFDQIPTYADMRSPTQWFDLILLNAMKPIRHFIIVADGGNLMGAFADLGLSADAVFPELTHVMRIRIVYTSDAVSRAPLELIETSPV